MKSEYLKNQFEIHKVFFGTTKKEIRKKKARLFEDEDYQYMAKGLTDGRSAGQCVKDANTCGKCYYYALMIAYGMQEGRIVHGVLHRLDHEMKNGGCYEEFNHAWVEVDDDLVYDPTMKAVFDRETYEKDFDAEKRKIYSVRELMRDEKSFEQVAHHATEMTFLPIDDKERLRGLFPQIKKEQTKN